MEAKCLILKWVTGVLLVYVVCFGLTKVIDTSKVNSIEIPQLRHEQ